MPVALVVALDGSLDGWWDADAAELELSGFDFESAVLAEGPKARWTWSAWAPSAALASWWTGSAPDVLGRTTSADAGSLRPRRVGPTVAEQFGAAGWRTWIAPGAEDLALWPPSWLGFEGGLAPGSSGVEAWPQAIEAEMARSDAGFLGALVVPMAELELTDADRAGAWRAWSARGAGATSVFEASEREGLAGGSADVWNAVRERTARRRGRPSALAFAALEQGARLSAADRWLAGLERATAAQPTELWVTCVGTIAEDQGPPCVPLFARGLSPSSGASAGEVDRGDVARWAEVLGERCGVRVVAPAAAAGEATAPEARTTGGDGTPTRAQALLWGSDPNRPYRHIDGAWQRLPDPFDPETAPSERELRSGWRLIWPDRVPPGELRVKLQAAPGESLQGWLIAERDGSFRAAPATNGSRAEWRFAEEEAPLWLAVGLARRGAPVLLEISLDGRALPEARLGFLGKPLGVAPLPRLADPSPEPLDAGIEARGIRLTSESAGARLGLLPGQRLFGARRWPPGELAWQRAIDPDAGLSLHWRAPGRAALAVASNAGFHPASELLVDRRRVESTAWVLWPVESPDPALHAEPAVGNPAPESGSPELDSAEGSRADGPTVATPPRTSDPVPLDFDLRAGPDTSRWNLEPLGAPFAQDPELWSREVNAEIWEQRLRELRRVPAR